ncbi:MAG: DUF6361 family protein [Firmicutes bacterium]|nr:DUF6361 family protein [Bacillota bacterium]
MASVFGWVDFLEKDREKMVDVIRMFSEQDTRDELGLGSVRDAFSNLMFPGTSTIQTRAKYMLFIPWIYRELEKQRTPSKDIYRKARNIEISLIQPLLDSGDTDGVIGKEAREGLQRLPSSIYWAGLGVWGIRLFDGSQEEYHRYLDLFYRRKKEQLQLRGDDKEPVAGRVRENWDPGLPEPPAGFPKKASLALSREEAEYLHEKIMLNCKDTLLAVLVNEKSTVTCDFIWMHPGLRSFPEYLREQVVHARCFSEIMHGAAILYNLMLAEKSGRQDLVKEYHDWLVEWKAMISSRKNKFKTWNRERFWDIVLSAAEVTVRTRIFINMWIDLVLNENHFNRLPQDETARRLIVEREVALKRGRARLENQRYLELWSGAAGTRQLNYRWNVVNTIVNDILNGLFNGRERKHA